MAKFMAYARESVAWEREREEGEAARGVRHPQKPPRMRQLSPSAQWPNELLICRVAWQMSCACSGDLLVAYRRVILLPFVPLPASCITSLGQLCCMCSANREMESIDQAGKKCE